MSRADVLASNDKKVQDHVLNGEATDAEIVAGNTESKNWVSVRRLVKAFKALVTPAVDDRSKSAANTEYVRNQIESPKQAFPAQVYRKNLIINGNFDVWQRGDTGSVTVANALYTADRWMVFVPANVTAKWDNTPFTIGNGFNGARSALLVTFTGNSAGANIRQRIEGVDTAAGKTVTVSFYFLSTVAQTCTVMLRQAFGAGGSPDVEYYSDFSATNNYNKFTATFNLSSVSGKAKGANDCLELIFVSKLATTHQVIISSVQLEIGAYATEYETRSYGAELNLCQRYFEKSFVGYTPIKSNNGPPTCVATYSQTCQPSTSQSALRQNFMVTKRSTPSLTLYSPGEQSGQIWAQTVGKPCSNTNIQSLWTSGFSLSCVTPSDSYPGYTLQVEWTADAEL